MKLNVLHSKSFVQDATELIIDKANESLKARGKFILGLCGGKTPEPVYAELAKKKALLHWDNIFITFGDERCVNPDHEESNFRMTKKVLFDQIELPPQNVYRIHGEEAPDKAAIDYEKEIMHLNDQNSDNIMRHDLLLLGMGDDGHTASLFPETSALSDLSHLVVSNFVPKFGSYRITFTYKLINASRHICFLVNDARKETVLNEILKGNHAYPATNVTATESLTWLLGF